MQAFNITRLNTAQGIVKMHGKQVRDDAGIRLIIEQFSLMGTDGWVLMEINSVNTMQLLAQIELEVLAHLTLKHHP